MGVVEIHHPSAAMPHGPCAESTQQATRAPQEHSRKQCVDRAVLSHRLLARSATLLARSATTPHTCRTSGERRLSNFVLWDLAYAELHFSQALWPDFSVADFDAALEDFSQRTRRFGSR